MSKLRPYFVVFSAATFFLFQFINMNSFDALNTPLRAFYHVDALQISDLSAMYFYGNTLLLIPAGLLLDRVSTRKLLLVTLFICILSDLVFSWVPSFTAANISRFIMGCGGTLSIITTAKLASRWFPSNRIALIMGLVVTMAMLGGIIAQQIPMVIDWTGSWQWAMTLVAALGVVFWVLMYAFVEDTPKGQEDTQASEQKKLRDMGFWSALFQALKNKQTWFAGIYTNLLSIPVVVMGALWVKSSLQVLYHQSLGHAEVIASMIFLGMVIGSPLAGWISDALNKRRMPMILGAVLTFAAALYLLEAHNLGFISLAVLFFLLGLFSSSQVITYAYVTEINPRHLTASSQALSASIIMSSGVIFQLLFGYIIERNWNGQMAHHMAIYSAQAYHNAMWILPAAFAVSIVIACFIKEPKHS